MGEKDSASREYAQWRGDEEGIPSKTGHGANKQKGYITQIDATTSSYGCLFSPLAFHSLRSAFAARLFARRALLSALRPCLSPSSEDESEDDSPLPPLRVCDAWLNPTAILLGPKKYCRRSATDAPTPTHTHVVPVVDEVPRRTAILVLHLFLNRHRREQPRYIPRQHIAHPRQRHHALKKLMPVTNGITLDLMRCLGESDPARFTSAKKRFQSASVTSCVANGCGLSAHGGGSSGNPLLSSFPLDSRRIGGKAVYGSCGGGRRFQLSGLPLGPKKDPSETFSSCGAAEEVEGSVGGASTVSGCVPPVTDP